MSRASEKQSTVTFYTAMKRNKIDGKFANFKEKRGKSTALKIWK